ncbi:MAG: hypothetical protein R3D88_03505 [Alphaproteobacteria bacterium]
MWIEVIGLPGVGKTTMIEKNIVIIENNYKIIKSDKSKIFQKIFTKIIYHFYFSLISNDKKLSQKLAYRYGFRLFKRKEENLFFFDSGILQVFLESLIEEDFKNQDTVLKLRSKIPNSNKIIYLKDNLNDIVFREINRSCSRFNLSQKETLKRYKQAEEFIEKELLQHSDIIVTIRSNNDLEFEKALKSEKEF